MIDKGIENAQITTYGKCFLMQFPEDKYRPPILHLQGNPYEVGKAHGYLYSDKITQFFAEYFTPVAAMFGGWQPESGISPSLEQMNAGKEVIFSLAENRCIPAIKAQEADYWREIEGLYDGLKEAGSPLQWNDILMGNCMPEDAWMLRDQDCSNFAAWDKATGNGKLIHGVNMDFETFDVMQYHVSIMVAKPEKGYSFLGIHSMGNISPNSWINEKGLSYGEMTCNSVKVKWPQIPHLMHGRKIAQEASTIKEAYSILENTGGTTGWANLIAEGMGNNPHAADIELVGKDLTIRYEDPEFKNVIWVTNIFTCYPGFQGYEGINMIPGQVSYWMQLDEKDMPDYIDPSITLEDVSTLEKWRENVICPRYERYAVMLKKAHGKIDIEKAIEIQSDKVLTLDRMPGKIQLTPPCKHFLGYERPIISNRVSSVWSCIFIPQDGDAWIAAGDIPAQNGNFWKINLSAHLELMEKHN